MFLGFILFNADNSLIGTLYYAGARLAYPIFPVTSAHSEYGPFVNAVLYALVTGIAVQVRAHRRS